ncbi:MAG: hypothetical protein AB7W59_21135 [Acidimicrobiia bacterium]
MEVLDDGTIAGLTANGVTFYDPDTAAPIRTVPLEVEVPARVGHDVLAVQADLLAVGTTRGTVTLIDGGDVRILTVSTHAVRSLAFGAGVIAVGTNDGTVHLLELESGQQRWATQVMPQQTYREVLGDDAWLALDAPLRDFYTGFEPLLLQTGPGNIIVEPSGRVVASAMLHLVALDGSTGEVAARTQNPLNPQHGIPFTLSLLSRLPDGTLLAAASFKAVRFGPDLDVLEDRAVPTGRMDTNVFARAVVVGSDGQPYWGLSNGQLARGTTAGPLDGAREVTGLTAALALAWAEDGTLLVAGPGGVVAWASEARTLLGVAVPDGGNAGTSISPDGTLLYASTLGSENQSYAYDLSGRAPSLLRRDHSPDYSYAVSPDPLGRYVDAFRLGELRFLDRTTSAHLATLPDASFTAFSFDGTRLAAVTFDSNELRVFDAQTFQPISPPLDISAWTHGFQGATPGFSADGTQLFAVFQATGEAVVMDTATWAVVRAIDPADHHGIIAARFGQDGNTLVTLGTDGSIALRDPQTWAFLRMLSGGISGTDSLDTGLYLSADGRYLLTTRDGKPRLWDLPSATLIGTFPHRAGLTASGNDLGAQLRLVTLDAGYALSWNLDVTAWPALACRAAGRNLTEDEWRQFGPRSTPYRATCPQWPSGV